MPGLTFDTCGPAHMPHTTMGIHLHMCTHTTLEELSCESLCPLLPSNEDGGKYKMELEVTVPVSRALPGVLNGA